MVRVVVVAPLPAMRAGLRALLRSDQTIEVVGEATSPAAARHLLPDADVLVVTAELLAQGWLDEQIGDGGVVPALLLLSDDPAVASIAARSSFRAWGVLSPEAAADELGAAVRALHAGLVVGSPPLLAPLLSGRLLTTDPVLEPLAEALTSRELEVLERLALGLANKQIAAALHISEHTVKFHVSSIYAKLGATNRTEAVRLGAARGLITL